MKYAAAIIAILILFVGGFFTGHYFKKVPERQPPQTILKDTIIYKDKIVYRDRPIPTPVILPGIPTPIYYYSDTLKTDSLDIVINDSIRGELLSREIVHKPMVFERYINKVEYVTNEVIKLKNPTLSLYGDVKTGGGPDGFIGAIELGIINKNRNKLGFSVFRSNSTFYCISYGYILNIY